MANIYGEKSNLRVQWEKVKTGTFREKLDWYFRYFGLYTLILLAVIAFFVALIVTITRKSKPEALSGILLDVIIEEEQTEKMHQTLCEELGLDPEEYAFGLTGTLYSNASATDQYYLQQSLVARLAAGELDLIGAQELRSFADVEEQDSGWVAPLNTYLTEAEIRALEEKGLVISLKKSSGERVPYFINIAKTPLGDLLRINVDMYQIGLVWLAPHPEQIRELVRFILGS